MQNNQISWSDFEKVDIRVGTITEALERPDARKPAYKVTVDLGPEIGSRKTSAQITDNYTCDQLIGRQVVCVVNFPPKQIGNFMSEVLLTGFSDDKGGIVLTSVERPVPNGSKFF